MPSQPESYLDVEEHSTKLTSLLPVSVEEGEGAGWEGEGNRRGRGESSL